MTLRRGGASAWYPWAFGGAAVAASLVLLWLASGATFRGDDWDLVARRSLSDPIGLLRPFNEQWITVPAVIFRLVFEVVGLHSYLPYLVVLLLLHVAVASAVWRLVATASGELAGLLAGVVVLFLGVGRENLHQAFQIGMVGSTAWGLWAIHAIAGRRDPALAAALLLVSVASHAVGAVFLTVAFVAAFATHRRAVVWCLVPVAIFAVWFVLLNLPVLTERSGSLTGALGSLPGFVGLGARGREGAVFGLAPLAGALILVGLATISLAARHRPVTPWLFLVGLLGIGVEYALIGLSRASFGFEAVGWSRYLYVAVPLVLLAVAGWFGPVSALPFHRQRMVSICLSALAAVAVLGNVRAYVQARDFDFQYVHRARAAVAISMWSDDARRPPSDVHIPEPAALRDLVARHGSPVRDSLIPSVVPEVPPAIAGMMCAEMVPAEPVTECEAAIADAVAGP